MNRMSRIEVFAQGIPLPGWTGGLEAFAGRVLEILNKDNWDLPIALCNNDYIRRLNAQYRDREEPTDILSFSLGETLEEEDGTTWYLPGDIVISLETLEENAGYFQVSPDEELRRLVIHGILHLDGMDHQGNETDEPMLALQERLLSSLAGERILPP